MHSLDESPEQYRGDASALAALAAASGGGVAALAAAPALAELKARADAGTLVYTRFVAVGLFRLLEIAGCMEPASLAKLAEAAGVPLLKVNADLQLYKGLLSKLQAAKELQAEMLARERRKRDEKAAGGGGNGAAPAAAAAAA